MTLQRLPDYIEHMLTAINLVESYVTAQTALPELKKHLSALQTH